MQSNYRHEEILRRLGLRGRVRVDELAGSLKVSTETIRRDLTDLEARGLARKVHGGAVPFRVDREPHIAERTRIRSREKAQIGALAASLVDDGMSIFVDAGSTATACARYLAERSNLTVTTNSLDIAIQLVPTTGIRVRVVPGIARALDNAIGGQEACSYVGRFAFDLALVGIGGLDEEMGWMDFEEDEASLRRIVAPRARRLVILADRSKFGRRAAVQTFPIDQPLTVVTDRAPPAPYSQLLRKVGTTVLKAV